MAVNLAEKEKPVAGRKCCAKKPVLSTAPPDRVKNRWHWALAAGLERVSIALARRTIYHFAKGVVRCQLSGLALTPILNGPARRHREALLPAPHRVLESRTGLLLVHPRH